MKRTGKLRLDDIASGDLVTVRNGPYPLLSAAETGEMETRMYGPEQRQFHGMPLIVIGVCLPFVAAMPYPKGPTISLDTRLFDLQRCNEEYAKAVMSSSVNGVDFKLAETPAVYSPGPVAAE